MKVSHLLGVLGIGNVPPVPPRETAGGTENHHVKQSCTPCSPCSPENKGITSDEQEASQSGSRAFSANPQNPQPIAEKKGQNPDALLADIARALKADAHMLRKLLSADDLADIAEGYADPALLAEWFKAMEQEGQPLADPQCRMNNLLCKAAANNAEWVSRWKAAHEPFINHLMGCRSCHAPRDRYCNTGKDLRQAYNREFLSKHRPRKQTETRE